MSGVPAFHLQLFVVCCHGDVLTHYVAFHCVLKTLYPEAAVNHSYPLYSWDYCDTVTN